MWKLILGILLILGVALLVVLSVAGLFDHPVIQEKSTGPYLLVYEKVQGEFQQAAVVMDRTHAWLEQQGVQSTKGFGLYFDDPRKTETANLRFIAGTILETSDADKQNLIAEKYLVRTFPEQRCVAAVFPYRSRLAVLFGILKVYPALEKFREEHGYPANAIMEIYDLPNKLITYLLPVGNDLDLLQEFYLAPEQPVPVQPERIATPDVRGI